MRHRVAKRHFNRDTKHRKAMIMNLVRSLVLEGEIKTTTRKAKEVKRWADKLVSTAKKGDLHARRTLHRFFGKRDVVNTLVDRIAPLFPDRKSGFTTHEVLGKRRGDNSEMTKLSFLVKPEVIGSLKSPIALDITSSKDALDSSKKAAEKKSESKTVEANKTGAKKTTASKASKKTKVTESKTKEKVQTGKKVSADKKVTKSKVKSKATKK